MKNNSKIKKAMSSGIAPLIAVFSILFIILIYMMYSQYSQAKPSYSEKEKDEMRREFVIEYFELEFRASDKSTPAQNKEYIPTDTTYKKVEAFNSWAKAYEANDGNDYEPITVEDILLYSDRMQDVLDIMSKHDGMLERIEDDLQGKYDYSSNQ